jgi:hypothetical protein
MHADRDESDARSDAERAGDASGREHDERRGVTGVTGVAVTVGPETESARGWRFDVSASDNASGSGGPASATVFLSWVDYDHWSRGSAPPARVVQAALTIAAERLGSECVTDGLDLSSLRRRVPGFDELLRDRL